MTGPSSWIETDRRLAIYLRDNFTCLYCGRDMKGCGRAEIGLDHLVPRSDDKKRPNHSSSNLITVCRSCNSRRGNRPWRNYAPGGAQDRIEAATAKIVNIGLAREVLEGYPPTWEKWS